MKLWRMKTILGLVIIALMFAFNSPPSASFAQTSKDQEKNVGKSWEKAEVYIPGNFFRTVPDKVSVEKSLPVVIYMHGCTGITNHDTQWANFIKGLGFIAVLPDSMAIPGRKMNCNPVTKRGGSFPQAHALRLQEIRYAFDQVKKSPWADTKNIFGTQRGRPGGSAQPAWRFSWYHHLELDLHTCEESQFRRHLCAN